MGARGVGVQNASKGRQQLALRDFLERLFVATQDKVTRGRLRAIRKRLRATAYLARFSQKVTPRFARDLHALQRMLIPLNRLFLRTIHNQDSRVAYRYRDWLVEAKIPEAVRVRRADFTYEMMKEKLEEAKNAGQVLKEIDKGFREFLEVLSEPDYALYDALLDDLERLASLTEYDFHAILSRFDPQIDLADTSGTPRFAAVPAEQLIGQLRDLYFVLGPVSVTDGIEELVCQLVSLVRKADAGDRETIARLIAKLRRSLQTAISGEVLSDLLRYVVEDPHLELETDQVARNYVSQYMSHLTERFERNQARCRREAVEESISRDFSSLFGKISLVEILGYSEQASEELIRDGLKGFTHVKPLAVLKSFLMARYAGTCKIAVDKLVEDGLFQSMRFKQNLVATCSGCEETLAKIERFEEDANGIGIQSVSAIRDLMERKKQEGQVASEIGKIINALNTKAKRIVDEGSGRLYKLGRLIRDVLDDHRTTNPTYVSNIRTIDGAANRDLIATLARGCNDAAKLVRIMKSFAVLDAKSFARALSGGAENPPEKEAPTNDSP